MDNIYFKNMHSCIDNLGNFAVDSALNGIIINQDVKYIIKHTGTPGSMFIVVKYFLFGEQNDHID